MMLLALALTGYLSGSLASAIWISKYYYGKDIRESGSGNAGASNMFRTFGWRPALLVTLLDMAKGAAPMLLVPYVLSSDDATRLVWTQMLVGACAIAGHVWTLFANFRGGKGVATAAGVLWVLFPLALPFCLLVYGLVVWRTRISSLGSILAALALPLFMLVHSWLNHAWPDKPLLIMGIGIPLAVLATHHQNIARLRSGKEPKLGGGK